MLGRASPIFGKALRVLSRAFPTFRQLSPYSGRLSACFSTVPACTKALAACAKVSSATDHRRHYVQRIGMHPTHNHFVTIALVVCCVVLITVKMLARILSHAPEGYEDASGFHLVAGRGRAPSPFLPKRPAAGGHRGRLRPSASV